MSGKCLFLDVDGTLVDEKTHRVPDSALEALRLTQQRGNRIFLNTGRPYSTISPMLKNLGFDGFCCGCGTEIIVDDEMIYRQELPKEICQRIKDKMAACHIDAVFENTPDCWIWNANQLPLLTETLFRLRQEGFDNMFPWQDGISQFTKFCIVYDDRSELTKFRLFLDTLDLEYIDRFSGFGEIVPKHCSKATAIEKVCLRYGIGLDDCYVFGDSTNDLPMLKAVRHSICMGNGDPQLFEHVEWVTARLEDDGLALAMKKYGLI